MEELLETLRCAQANFDNLIKMIPQIEGHPIYKIARMQLDDGVKKAEKIADGQIKEAENS